MPKESESTTKTQSQRPSQTNSPKRIRAQRYVQNGQTHYVCALHASELNELVEVPRYDPVTKTGYQRDISERRARKAAEHVAKGGTFPGAVILSLRAEDREGLQINELPPEAHMSEVEIVIPEGKRPFKLLDGQHRDKALEILRGESSEFASQPFGVATVIVESHDEVQEATTFRTIHKEQKGVSTDLTNRILEREVDEGGADPRTLLESGQKAKYREYVAVKLMEALSTNTDSPWHGLIRPTNAAQLELDEGAEEPDWAITEHSMATSLRDYVRAMQLTPINRSVLVLKTFWRAVAHHCADAWGDPEEYPYLQKTTGVAILNLLLPTLYQKVRESGPVTQDAFEDVLDDLGVDSDYFAKGGPLRGIGGYGGFKTKVQELEAKLLEEPTEA